MPYERLGNSSNKSGILVTIVLVVAILYFAKEILIPLALSVLLSFLLSPIVRQLQRLGLSRIPAVLITTFLSFAIIGVLVFTVSSQVLNLARNLPKYESNIEAKIHSLRGSGSIDLKETSETVKKLTEELSKSEIGESASPNIPKVEIVEPPPSAVQVLRDFAGPLFKPLGVAAVVILFVIFMLLKREDLRDRVIRLIGTERLNVTTQAMDDAASRVSRYLLMQSIINGTQGLLVGTGLYFIGLPNAALWGVLSAVLRFIPYIGPWLGAGMPIILSLAVFDNWTYPLLTVLLFVVLELITNNILEPWLYGAHTGISSFALIIAAVFWTWLWGSIGLLLSTPLTVCLVVMGKYISQLEFISILLSDEPVLEPESRFYQRLLAMDSQEADNLIDDYLKERPLIEVCDTIIVPALGLAEQDRHLGRLDEDRRRYIVDHIKELIDDLFEEGKWGSTSEQPDSTKSHDVSILCLPAYDEADEVTAMLFAELLQMKGLKAEFVSVKALKGEMMDLVKERRADLVCISALPPSTVRQARYLCKRLRSRFPDLPILVGLWNAQGDLKKVKERLKVAGTDKVVTTFAQGIEQVRQIIQPLLYGVRKEFAPEALQPDKQVV
ncbi:MAG TPA: AI-2E family transporter [Thermodesulfobacteriota bacterium]|nr:AI-2E family transporter [Thermodesulfobacteriota bacterium]